MFIFSELFNELIEVFIKAFECSLGFFMLVGGFFSALGVTYLVAMILFTILDTPLALIHKWKQNKKNKEII